MTPGTWALLLAAAAIVLMVAEILLPTHGVLGLLALASYLGTIGICFFINQWIGLGLLLGSLVLAPFAASAFVRLWPKTPVGRGMLLPDNTQIAAPPTPVAVQLGQIGVAISQLRPMGEVEFGDLRLEASSEYGVIEPGQKVKVVAIGEGLPTVRAIHAEAATAPPSVSSST